MYATHLELGSMIIDVDGKRLEAKFLRETGAIDDYFTIIKDVEPAPFRIVKFWNTAGQTVARWKSTAGRSYRVQQSSTLNPASWVPISDAIIATGATTSWTNHLPAPTERMFYRVVETEE
jgi:hypothetical protein